ncbi:hypothetical protein AC1031_015051 [Aphanomyces cochlioides]|nr:hypothetical protein AC1031_015051 [Aphanomyces cochlioides]
MRQAQYQPRSPPKKPGIYLLDDDFDQSMFMTNPRNAPLHKEDYIVLKEYAILPGGAVSLHHPHKTENVPFRKWIRQFWQLLQKQAMWQVLAFRFITNIFQNFDSVAVSPMGQYWAKVQPFMDGITKAIGRVFYTMVLIFVGRFGLNWNWRWTIAITTICLIAIDGTVYFLAIWDVIRDPWFYTGVKLTDQLPTGVRFIVSAFVATELADLGNEGAVYGLVTTVSNLASPVSSAFYKFVDGFFELQDASFKLEKNTTSTDVRNYIRWQVSYSFIVAYGMKLFALVWLFLLPPQKAHVQRLKRYGMVSRLAGGLSMFLFGCFLTFSVFTNLVSIFDATSWWRRRPADYQSTNDNYQVSQAAINALSVD